MKRWVFASNIDISPELSNTAHFSPLILQLLSQRGFKTLPAIERFLNPALSNLPSPFEFPDLEKAYFRIKKALKKQERIILFGDYDVDGITSLAMMIRFLRAREGRFIFLIPSRLVDGYGFGEEACRRVKKEKPHLLIALDCGTNSQYIYSLAREGLDIVVIDHHEVLHQERNIKRNIILVNPKRKDSHLAFREIPTAGIVFRLLEALAPQQSLNLIDLAALGIVCDVAPLQEDNRIVVKEGLAKLRYSPLLGIKTMSEYLRLCPKRIDTFHLGWIIGPRLNASGRMKMADPALELLITEKQEKAEKLVELLEENNFLRRKTTKEVMEQALIEAEKRDDLVFVLAGENWHLGVLGIVASFIKRKYSRPVFVISFADGVGKGSARSIEGFNLMEALESLSYLLSNFGGHKKAAGIEIKKENLEEFRRQINLYAQKLLSPHNLVEPLFIDKEIDFSDISLELADDLDKFSPFGEGNPEPVFCTRKVQIKNITKANSYRSHYWFTQKGKVFPAQIKNDGSWREILNYGGYFDLAYGLTKENSSGSLSLKIRDIKISG